MADCYGGWIAQKLLEEAWEFAEDSGDSLPALTERFEHVNGLLGRALVCHRMQSGESFFVTGMLGNHREVTARWLLLHPITHEFHHKGQVVTLLRRLGHPVSVDLDLPPPGGW